jgi:hypothetical protein
VNTGHFLRCRDCEAVFRPSPRDRAPEYRCTPDGYVVIVRDDCVGFLTQHARHALETLRPTSAGPVHAGPLCEPLASMYWEVSNGGEALVVEGWRETLTGPVQYRVVPGRLVVERIAVEIPEDEIRADVDRALYPGVAPERKLAAFVAAFTSLVWSLDPATFETLYDVPGDATSSIARLPAPAMEELLASAGRIFGAGDRDRLAARLADSADGFTVLVRCRVTVRP